jgi:hypothetical protein
VDIGEPLLVIIEPEALEEAPPNPLPPGWEEFNIYNQSPASFGGV